MRNWGNTVVALALAAGIVASGLAWAGKKPVELIRTWTGSVADDSLMPPKTQVIDTAQKLRELWERWKIQEPLPRLDFTRELVVAEATRGSLLRLAATLDDKGNLEVLGMASLDFRPGFRYVIATVSRAGVKTVNNQKLTGLPPGAGEKGQPGRFLYNCEGGRQLTVELAAGGDSLLLHQDGEHLRLPRVPAASGEKFHDGETTFWMKGNLAFLKREGRRRVIPCVREEN